MIGFIAFLVTILVGAALVRAAWPGRSDHTNGRSEQ